PADSRLNRGGRMRPRSGTVAAALLCLPLVVSAAPASAGPAGPAPALPGTARNVTLVGHDPLFGRGMNAALALYGSYIYVGNRTDASTTCLDGQTTTSPHPPPGVLVVAAADPSRPHAV